MKNIKSLIYLVCIFFSATLYSSCIVSTVVGTTVDTTLEVAKVPFKVASAAFELATSEEDEE